MAVGGGTLRLALFGPAGEQHNIHPAVLASKGGGMEPEMWTVVWINFVAWGVLFGALVLARYHGAGLKRRVEAALLRIQEKTLQ